MRSYNYPEFNILDSLLALLVTFSSSSSSSFSSSSSSSLADAPSIIQGLPSSHWKCGCVSVTPCNTFSSVAISSAFEGTEDDSRQMGPLTSRSLCGAPVTTESFCHLCCHQIKADPRSTKKSISSDS